MCGCEKQYDARDCSDSILIVVLAETQQCLKKKKKPNLSVVYFVIWRLKKQIINSQTVRNYFSLENNQI